MYDKLDAKLQINSSNTTIGRTTLEQEYKLNPSYGLNVKRIGMFYRWYTNLLIMVKIDKSYTIIYAGNPIRQMNHSTIFGGHATPTPNIRTIQHYFKTLRNQI